MWCPPFLLDWPGFSTLTYQERKAFRSRKRAGLELGAGSTEQQTPLTGPVFHLNRISSTKMGPYGIFIADLDSLRDFAFKNISYS
jgi:hypothetical protein